MSIDFDAYHKWLGIAPDEQPPHYYRLLAIRPFEEDLDVIENAADQRMVHLRSFGTSRYVDISQRLLNEVAAAKVCLLNPQKKADYDAKLHALLDRQSVREDSPSPPKGLKEQSELLAGESPRPASQDPRPSSNMPWPLLSGCVAAALLLALAAWALLGRGSGQPAAGGPPLASAESQHPKVTSSDPLASVSPKPPAAAPQSPIAHPPSPIPASSDQPVRADVEKLKADEQPIAPGPPPSLMGDKQVAKKPSVIVPPPKPGATLESPAVAKVDVATQKSSPKPSSSNPQSPIPDPAASRLPIPADSAQDEARRQAQALYRDDYSKAKKSVERAALAGKILKQAQEPSNAPTDRYVLLCLARDVAIQADDGQRAFEAVDELAKSFDVDGLSLKADVLTAQVKSAHATAAHKSLCERALSLGREAIEQDKLDLAGRLAKLAYTEAGKVRDKELLQRSRAVAKEEQEAAKAYATVEEASQTLKATPEDPAANLAIGKYLCFTKGDWSKGLSHLAKGDDEGLKSLADDERKNTPPTWEPAPGVAPPDPPPASAALRLADGWWNAGLSMSGKQRDRILLHAGYWYNQSFGSDIVPLVVAKINGRLEQIEKIRRQYPAFSLAIAPFDGKQAKQYQQRFAEHLGAAVVQTNSIGMKLALIPPGEFEMGSAPIEVESALAEGRQKNPTDKRYFEHVPTEAPRHRVRINKAFYLGMYHVTQGEYKKVMGVNPSDFTEKQMDVSAFKPPLSELDVKNRRADVKNVAGTDDSRRPVETINWDDAVEFCRRLSAMPAERDAGRVYRLPSEAEWEYACRAGTTTRWYCGDDEAALADVAWFNKNAGGITHAVGKTKPNAWGLYDMHGNVWQWCADWFTADYYKGSPLSDPTGPDVGFGRVQRGGHWGSHTSACRSAHRNSLAATVRSRATGFRVAVGR
jgi:formylglycine-generating enzyme required for sulfatase activity